MAWAAYILGLAMLIGLVQQWPLVRQSWRGELATRLEQARSQRRQEQFQGVQTVNLAQAYALFQQGQALFIDARPADEYAELHIPKAISLPEALVEKKGVGGVLAGIPKEHQIVVYCGMVSCNAALTVAEKLEAQGFSQVTVFLGGFRAWDEAGYPADTSE